MDKITKGNLKSFKEEQSLDINEESILFEHFSNYCVVSKEYNNSFAIDDIHVGSGQDKSIDGIAIIINGNLITSEQEVEDLAKSNKYLDVSFILIQSKTSSTFDTGDIAKFMIGAKEFFDDQNNVPHNSKIQEKAEIMEYVYQASSLFRNRNPNLNLYYVTTGKWVDDSTINGTVSSLKKILKI
ncbi:hypothetical protein [Cyanothece sp. BG0011]|uniref:hypothetical protein n=1 Tax=Cyanothece sp. BG0011 TaxID=2082950 RepID=UPI000D1DCB67|nr:hypothetical protein [Cyanothece sp. BG0011]